MEPETAGIEPCSVFAPDGVAEAFRAEWRTETVVGLAEGVIADRAFERLPILADALEEAGCDLPAVLDHCREPNRHDIGCWVLTVVTGREAELTVAHLQAELDRLEAELEALTRDIDLEAIHLAQERERLERELTRLLWRRRWQFRFRMLVGMGIGWFVGQAISYFLLGIR